MLRSYLRLILFTLGLLVGVQVPGFIEDYAKRVDAHRLEAEQGLKGFREPLRASSRATSTPWWPTTAQAPTR
jgi:hypothetical protein